MATFDFTAIRRVHRDRVPPDAEFWRTRPPEERVAALVSIRREYHGWADDARPDVQRVCRRVKRP